MEVMGSYHMEAVREKILRASIGFHSLSRLFKELGILLVCSLGMVKTFNLLSPNSDENENFLYIIKTCSNIQVMRKKKVITKDKMSRYLSKFSLLVP